MDPRTSGQDVMRCDTCKTAVVQMHCLTCPVNLCKACVGEHVSADLSKSHKIVDFKDRNSTVLYPGCTSHDKGRCKMYCKHCNIPVCTKCIASDQHLGHKLSEILEVLNERKDKLTKDQTELNEDIYPTFQDIASDVQTRMSQLEKEYGDLSIAITKHGEEWHREIDKLVKKLKDEVEEMKNTQMQTLQENLDEINKKIFEIKEEINLIDVSVTSNDISKLFSTTSNVHVDKYRQLPHKIVLSSPTFSQEKIHGKQLSKLFGALSLTSSSLEKNGYSTKATHQNSKEAGFSPSVKQLLDEPETVTTIGTGYRELYNVACLSDEEIWTSGNGNIMELYSINQGSLLKSIKTKSGIWQYLYALVYTCNTMNIAVTESGDLVYTDNDRTVNIVKNEKIEVLIRLQNWRPLGVCSTSAGDLLVILYSNDDKQTKVVRYSGSTEKQIIQFDDKGKPLYSSGSFYIRYLYITENKNLDICVSDDGARAVVVVSQAGRLRFRYTGHTPALKNKSFSPVGITTDSQSHILTADVNNECVHIIDQNGQFLRYIDCGLSEPQGLCTDTNDNLFVAQQRNKQLKKIKYLQ